jgi:hypothetical protein
VAWILLGVIGPHAFGVCGRMASRICDAQPVAHRCHMSRRRGHAIAVLCDLRSSKPAGSPSQIHRAWSRLSSRSACSWVARHHRRRTRRIGWRVDTGSSSGHSTTRVTSMGFPVWRLRRLGGPWWSRVMMEVRSAGLFPSLHGGTWMSPATNSASARQPNTVHTGLVVALWGCMRCATGTSSPAHRGRCPPHSRS